VSSGEYHVHFYEVIALRVQDDWFGELGGHEDTLTLTKNTASLDYWGVVSIRLFTTAKEVNELESIDILHDTILIRYDTK
jgi:hypothetical protein